jgi:CDGSH-type Zn-finger protein
MSDVSIKVNDSGPYLVSGPITVIDAEGNQFDLGGKETVALCRCGHSSNLPFCDGSHRTCKFDSTVRVSSG